MNPVSVILSSYKKLQKKGMMWNIVHRWRGCPGSQFVFYVPIIRSDTEEADSQCGKFKPRTRNIKQLCWQCMVPTLGADDHLANYPPKTQTKIQKLPRDAESCIVCDD